MTKRKRAGASEHQTDTYVLLNRFAPTLQRQNTEISKQIFPENEYRGPPILLEEICRPILGLYKSFTDT